MPKFKIHFDWCGMQDALRRIDETVIEAEDEQDADEQFQKIIENTPGCSYFPFFSLEEQDFLAQAEQEKKELAESYKESVRQTQERRAKEFNEQRSIDEEDR